MTKFLFVLLFVLLIVLSLFSFVAHSQSDLFYFDNPIHVKNSIAENLLTNNADLCLVADNTLHYLEKYTNDSFAVHAGKVFDKKITLQQVKNTLIFICEVVREDKLNGRSSRLVNKKFLLEHFNFIRWQPDIKKAQSIAKKSTNAVKSRMLNAIPKDKLFLTKYYTKLLLASAVKTEKYNQALYAIPFDEKALSLEEAEQKKQKLTRFKYTRQQIINGALLNNKLAQPLVWLTEEALHDVLLQGTGVLNIDGETRYFNVHRNNGIAYNYSIGKRAQARYWYFIETPEIMGYGKTQASKIALKPQVSLAGNIAQLGLGKLVMLNYSIKSNVTQLKEKTTRLAVLADQGGAFDDNLFQLDLLVDSYKGWEDYHQANKYIPDYAEVWLLILKDNLLPLTIN